MKYQKVLGDLEDFAREMAISKARQGFFRIATEQETIEGMVPIKLEDGTTVNEKARGIRFTSTITLTAVGFLNPIEADSKVQGASLNPVKADMQLVFTAPIAQKECFRAEDKAAYDQEVEANWKAVIKEVSNNWKGPFYEGVISIMQ